MAQFTFEAIGTKWRIEARQDLSKEEEALIFSAIKDRIDSFDKAYSRFRADSLVTKMSKKAGNYPLPADAHKMISLYRDIYDLTGGLVTPLVGDLISDAGYDAEYSLKQKQELKAPLKWEEAIEFKSPDLLIKKPVLLDFGAAGKGYLIDLVAQVLEAHGVHEYSIDAGGDIIHRGKEPIRVGLEDPEDLSKVVGVYILGNRSIAGSAGNRRKWGDFTHIIDPKTLRSPTGIMAVWVVADTTILADALSTCLFFVDARSLAGKYRFEYALVRSDRSIEKSADFSGEIFLC